MNRESGHTLVETLVAMALFLGVLIPVIGIVAGLLFDRAPERSGEALLIARNEALAFATGPEEESVASARKGFTVHRREERAGFLLEVSITVRDSAQGGKVLATLHRSLLEYPE